MVLVHKELVLRSGELSFEKLTVPLGDWLLHTSVDLRLDLRNLILLLDAEDLGFIDEIGHVQFASQKCSVLFSQAHTCVSGGRCLVHELVLEARGLVGLL